MGEKKTEEESGEKREGIFEGKGLLTFALAALVVVVAFNQFQIATLYSLPLPAKIVAVAAAAPAASSGSQQTVSENRQLAASPDIIPTGTPGIYGAEIGVKYDDLTSGDAGRVDLTINKLTNLLGGDPGNVLKGAELERYVKIGSMIACEYCCGAKSIMFAAARSATAVLWRRSAQHLKGLRPIRATGWMKMIGSTCAMLLTVLR